MRTFRKFLRRQLQPYISAWLQAESFSEMAVRCNLAALRTQEILSTERAQDPKRLLAYGFKGYSQNDEDGILQEIFHRIGTASRTFIEIGVGPGGRENNTVYLLLSGWRGLWIEAADQFVSAIRKGLAPYLQSGDLALLHDFVAAENVNALFRSAGMSGEIDLLSIDIDGNDYWVWNAVTAVDPRVVVVEYNATFRPPVSVAMEYCKDRLWDETNFYGASLKALEAVGYEKGYALVGCNITGTNAFFVRQDLVQDRFCAPFTAENHYEPPRFSLFLPQLDTHPPGVGRYETVAKPSVHAISGPAGQGSDALVSAGPSRGGRFW